VSAELTPRSSPVSDRWSLVETVQSRLAEEQGAIVREADLQVALCYPSPYHVGMSSLGFQTIYREIHAHPGCAAERAFLPDDVAAWRESGTPLFTYERQRSVGELPMLAFSVSYELEVAGVCEMLDLAGLPILSSDRRPSDPLIVMGGPLTFSNPLPLAPFADVLVLGEAEELIHTLLDLMLEGTSRAELLDRLAKLPGFYVPGRSLALGVVAKADDDRLPARSQILTPHTELRSMFLIEPERGCSRGCTYCVMRRSTNGGMRTVSPERVLELVPAEAKRVGLVGAAVTDHPELPELLEALIEGGKQVGVSSLRADRLSARLVGLLKAAGARSITTAADGASERLRRALDRKTTETQLERVAQLTRDNGLAHLKLYLMVGIPGETDDDIDELIRFGKELSRIIPLVYGVASFVAKRNTPMDGAPFEPIASLDRKLDRMRRGLKGRAEVRATSTRWAWVEYQLAQCGPEAGLAAMDAWRAGGSFAAWKRAVKERGLQPHEAKRVEDGRLRLPTLAAWPSISPAPLPG
jgi:radical SAM superfamily enzyme YgiQ (UPF0313 family)